MIIAVLHLLVIICHFQWPTVTFYQVLVTSMACTSNYNSSNMHTEVQSPSTTHSKYTFFLVLTSLLDLLWHLWVLVAREVQAVPEIVGYVNESI